MENDNYTVVNIRDYLQSKEKEEFLEETLAGFSCMLNPSVEKFLKERSIEFAKKNQSVTYLVFSNEDASCVGYFTLASKPITVKAKYFSKNMQRKISRVSEYNKEHQTFLLSSYLIAQLGKNFTNSKKNHCITGQQLMDIAIQKIMELQYMLGGMAVILEAEYKDKLLEFYINQNDFIIFNSRNANSMNNTRLVQMLKIL